jgi:hypothetical protein
MGVAQTKTLGSVSAHGCVDAAASSQFIVDELGSYECGWGVFYRNVAVMAARQYASDALSSSTDERRPTKSYSITAGMRGVASASADNTFRMGVSPSPKG